MNTSDNFSDKSDSKKRIEKSTLVAIVGITAFVVITYLGYDLIKPAVAPCESILEQSSIQLQTKLNLLGSGTEMKLGPEKVQELSTQAQLAAVNLKGCCIVLKMGKVNADEFLQCQGAVQDYKSQVQVVSQQVDKAVSAQESGDTKQFKAAVESIEKKIKEGSSQSKNLKTSILKGDLRLQATLTEGADPLHSCFYVYHAKQDIDGNRVKVNDSCTTTARFTLDAGRYYVYAKAGNSSVTKEFDVMPGQLSNEILNLNGGKLRLQAALTEGAEPLHSCFYVYHAKQDIDGNRVKVNDSCTTTARFTLDAGHYYVYAKAGNSSVTKEFDVMPGQLLNEILNLNGGKLRLQAALTEGAEPLKSCFYVYHAKQDIDGNRVKVNDSCTTTARFTLDAGRYHVYAKAGNSSVTKEFDVMPGQLSNEILNLNGGKLRLQAALTEGAEPLKSCFYVYHAKQDIDGNRVKVNDSCTTTARFTLNAGRYYVYAKAGNSSVTKEFDIKPGQLSNEVLNLNGGKLRLQAALTEGADPLKSCFYVYHAKQDIDGNRVKVNDSCITTAHFTLDAGRYYVYAKAGNSSVTKEFDINPGQLINQRLLFITQKE